MSFGVARGGLVVTEKAHHTDQIRKLRERERSDQRTEEKREALVQILFSLSSSPSFFLKKKIIIYLFILSFAVFRTFWRVAIGSTIYPDFFQKKRKKKKRGYASSTDFRCYQYPCQTRVLGQNRYVCATQVLRANKLLLISWLFERFRIFQDWFFFFFLIFFNYFYVGHGFEVNDVLV